MDYDLPCVVHMHDCHYYFDQDLIDEVERNVTSIRRWFVSGMEFTNQSLSCDIMDGLAHLKVENGADGFMDIEYSPNRNMSYRHKNLQLKGDYSVQSVMEVPAADKVTPALKFVAVSTTEL